MARLVIEVLANAAKAKAEFASLDKSTASVGDKLKTLRAPATVALAGVAAGALAAVKGASDLNETVSKSQQIFGKQAGAMETWSNGAAKAFGLSKAEALDAATSFGDMFSQIGFGGKQAADMSKSVVGLSADLGSFNNLPTADVNERISAAFRGEYDSLQALIPNINAARVETEAMAATGKKSAKELTAQEKASAVLAIVQKDGAKAAGDFARTQDGAANKTKIAQAQAADLAASLGQRLLPAYAGALGMASQFLDFLSQNQGAVAATVAGIAALAAVMLAASAATAIYNGVMAVKAGVGFVKSGIETIRIMRMLATDAVRSAAVQVASQARIGAAMAAGSVKAWAQSAAAAVKSGAVQVAANVRVGASWLAVRAKAVAASVAGWAAAAAAAVRSAAIQVAALAKMAAGWVLTRVQALAAGAVVVAQWVAMQAAALASAAVQVAATIRTAAAYAVQRGAMLAGVAAMAVVRGATIAYTAAQWLLNAALTANPIGIIVVAIGLLIAGLVLAWRNSETFRTIVTGAFNAVAKVAQVVWSYIKQGAQIAWAFITGYVRTQLAVVRAVVNAVKSGILAAWTNIKRGAELAWAGIKAVVTGVVRAVTTVVNTYRALVLTVWRLIRTGANAAWNAIKSTISSVIAAAVSKFNTLKSTASTVVSKIKSLFSPGALINAGRQLISGLAAGIRQKIDAAVGAVRAGVQKIKNLLPGSPIKDGPLKSWNNGGAGKRLMSLLARGLRAGGQEVERELEDVLAGFANPTLTPSVSLGASDLPATAAGGGTVQQITLEVKVDPTTNLAEVGRELTKALAAYKRAGGKLVPA